MARIGVFTAVDDPSFLQQAFESLQQQSCSQWEWHVVTDGEQSLPTALFDDNRVHVHVSRPRPFGTLYDQAVRQCSSPLLVRLRQSDQLPHDALQHLVTAHEQDADAGIYYGDFVSFRPSHSCQVYDAVYGWKSYPYMHDGRHYTAMQAFAVDASALYNPPYTPIAWAITPRAYRVAGGYDKDLDVAEDYALLVRAYLAGVKFRQLDRCLYFKRVWENERGHRLEDQEVAAQQEITNKHTMDLVREWCRRDDLLMVNLTRSDKQLDGFQNIKLRDAVNHNTTDATRLQGPDSNGKHLGVPAGARIGAIRAYDVLQYLTHGAEVVRLMNYLYQSLMPGGWLITATPSTDGRGAFMSPDFQSWWNETSFWPYVNRQIAEHVQCYHSTMHETCVECRFLAARLWTGYFSQWHQNNQLPHVFADLVALKEQRQPGYAQI